MSEPSQDDRKDVAAAPSADSTPHKEDSPASPPPVRPRQTAAALGAVALLVALLSVAAAAWLWNGQREQRARLDELTEAQAGFAQRSRELEQLRTDIENLVGVDRGLDEDFTALTKRIERQLEELPARITRIEGVIDEMPGIAEGERSAWLLAETEYYLRLANAQLSLAGNVNVALQALNLADEKIKDIGDPKFTPVRARISEERTALKAVPRPDAEGIVLELGSLARVVGDLPLSRAAPDRFGSESASVPETGWQRAWRVIVDALSSIISVRRNDEEITPLMSAAEENLLRRSLEIELQIARLAVIRNDGNLYRESLGAAARRLAMYFDDEDLAVGNVLATLETLAGAQLPEELPEISGSLSLLLDLAEETSTR